MRIIILATFLAFIKYEITIFEKKSLRQENNFFVERFLIISISFKTLVLVNH